MIASVIAGVVASTALNAADTMQADFTAKVTVGSNGTPELGEFSGVSGKLADAVRSEVQKLRFIPAQDGGVTMRSTQFLKGRVVLTPIGETKYGVQLQGVALRPVISRELAPPRYPKEHAHKEDSGAVEMMLRIGVDGRIVNAEMISSSGPAFEREVRKALRSWTFETAGKEAEIAVPFWFYFVSGKRAAAPPVFRCQIPIQQAHIAGQDGCLDRIEVAAAW